MSLLLSSALLVALAAFSSALQPVVVLQQLHIDSASVVQQPCLWYSALSSADSTATSLELNVYVGTHAILYSVLGGGNKRTKNVPMTFVNARSRRDNAWRFAKIAGSMRKHVVPLRVSCGRIVRALHELCATS